ncbi:MAG: diguanylate cyclase [Planctomycetes bacterium]|nr:diguanylate cyclase [Planctomycetota bacterium]
MKILVAEDDPVYRKMLETMLVKWGYEVIICSDGSHAWEILTSGDAPKFVILDWMMPGMDGMEVCRKIRENIKDVYVYILLLTAKNEMKDIIEGMEAGADDYITKPFHANELKVRLRAGRRILELQEELISSREALRIMATRDALTGLLNRRAIIDALSRRIAQSNREKTSVGVVLSDIDYFKNINDTFGHLIGDAALRETAKRLLSLARQYDDLGRYGGEEFLIVLPGCNLEDTVTYAERLRVCIEKNVVKTSEVTIPVTMSMGVTASVDGKATDVESIIHTADNALYRAKNNGRNRVEFAIYEKS